MAGQFAELHFMLCRLLVMSGFKSFFSSTLNPGESSQSGITSASRDKSAILLQLRIAMYVRMYIYLFLLNLVMKLLFFESVI